MNTMRLEIRKMIIKSQKQTALSHPLVPVDKILFEEYTQERPEWYL